MTLIRQRFGTEPIVTPGKKGQFTVTADGDPIAERGGNWLTRSFGAGYPDLEDVVKEIEKRGAPPPPRRKP